jgi:hypothetical protein
VTGCIGPCPNTQKMSLCGLGGRYISLKASNCVPAHFAQRQTWLFTNIPMRSSSPSTARFVALKVPGAHRPGRPRAAGIGARRTAREVDDCGFNPFHVGHDTQRLRYLAFHDRTRRLQCPTTRRHPIQRICVNGRSRAGKMKEERLHEGVLTARQVPLSVSNFRSSCYAQRQAWRSA